MKTHPIWPPPIGRTRFVMWKVDSAFQLIRQSYLSHNHAQNNNNLQARSLSAANRLHFSARIADRPDSGHLPSAEQSWVLKQNNRLTLPLTNGHHTNDNSEHTYRVERTKTGVSGRFPYAVRINLLLTGGKRNDKGGKVIFGGSGRNSI